MSKAKNKLTWTAIAVDLSGTSTAAERRSCRDGRRRDAGRQERCGVRPDRMRGAAPVAVGFIGVGMVWSRGRSASAITPA
jgi:hypothetical protein